MRRLLALDTRDSRAVLRTIGAVGVGVGVAFAAAPRLGLRVMGLEADGRGVSLVARLFASRDVAIGVMSLRASSGEDGDVRRWLELIALSQVLDLGLSAALWRSGMLSRRAAAVMFGTATPTLLIALAGRR